MYNREEPRRYIGQLPSPEAIAFIEQLRKTRREEKAARLSFCGHTHEYEDVMRRPEERENERRHQEWLKSL